jgi:hypothetical protein
MGLKVLDAGNSGILVVSSRSAGGLSAGNIHFLCDFGAAAGLQTRTHK